jgi:hypothetical protein
MNGNEREIIQEENLNSKHDEVNKVATLKVKYPK